MELGKVVIEGFKSIKQRVMLIVDPRISIFIGANDHGKTNILEAVMRLNEDAVITEDDVHWDLPPTTLARIEWHFKCSDATIASIQNIVDREAEIVIDEDTVVDGPEGEADTVELVEETGPEPLTEANDEKILILYREGCNSPIRILSAPIPIPLSKEEDIIALRPRVELFSPPNIELKDETTLRDLTEGKDFEFMQGIFRLAGIWEERDAIFTANDQNSRTLDEASLRLTDVLNGTWNQGKDLKWHLKHKGTNKIVIQIEDPSVQGRYTRPSLKSSGFRTYFLLSMITLARAKSNPSNSYIYLFDEPGTNLHPRAQIDLQRSFEALSDDTQILYTTHSLFLINKNYPDRNIVVVKTTNGTTINLKPFQKNWKAVRESLGILLSNNFLIAEKTILVEGPSDVIYLLNAVKGMKKKNLIETDLNDLSIVDAGDASNYIALARLMLEEGRSVLAIMDGDISGNSTKARLEKVCKTQIKDKTLQIVQLPPSQSIEDVLANLPVLRVATQTVVNNLVSDGTRVLKTGIDLNLELKKIKTSTSKTLGNTFDEVTKSWFEPEEKLSKLSVSLSYEDNPEAETIENSAQELVNNIVKLLALRSEKAYEEGVFEEV